MSSPLSFGLIGAGWIGSFQAADEACAVGA